MLVQYLPLLLPLLLAQSSPIPSPGQADPDTNQVSWFQDLFSKRTLPQDSSTFFAVRGKKSTLLKPNSLFGDIYSKRTLKPNSLFGSYGSKSMKTLGKRSMKPNSLFAAFRKRMKPNSLSGSYGKRSMKPNSLFGTYKKAMKPNSLFQMGKRSLPYSVWGTPLPYGLYGSGWGPKGLYGVTKKESVDDDHDDYYDHDEYHDHDDSEEEAEVELENVDLEAVNDAEDADITEVKRGDTEFWAARGKRAVNFWAPAHSWTLRGPRPKKPADNFWATRGKRGGDITGDAEEEGGVQAILEQEQE